MILEIYIAFFVLASLFLIISMKYETGTLMYLAMGLFLFSSLTMAYEGVDVVTGNTVVTNPDDSITINYTYDNLDMDNNFFVMSYVYIFLILPIIGILSSIYYAQREVNRR
jgi:TRAP-type C4-dicarboxylate transport system permease small subunit